MTFKPPKGAHVVTHPLALSSSRVVPSLLNKNLHVQHGKVRAFQKTTHISFEYDTLYFINFTKLPFAFFFPTYKKQKTGNMALDQIIVHICT